MAKQINFKDCLTLTDYRDALAKLDMQVGDCYAAIDKYNKLSYMWLVVERDDDVKYKSFGSVYRIDLIVVLSRGGAFLKDEFIDAEYPYSRKSDFAYILQIDRNWFYRISKPFAIFSSVLNAYQVELKKLIEEKKIQL